MCVCVCVCMWFYHVRKGMRLGCVAHQNRHKSTHPQLREHAAAAARPRCRRCRGGGGGWGGVRDRGRSERPQLRLVAPLWIWVVGLDYKRGGDQGGEGEEGRHMSIIRSIAPTRRSLLTRAHAERQPDRRTGSTRSTKLEPQCPQTGPSSSSAAAAAAAAAVADDALDDDDAGAAAATRRLRTKGESEGVSAGGVV